MLNSRNKNTRYNNNPIRLSDQSSEYIESLMISYFFKDKSLPAYELIFPKLK